MAAQEKLNPGGQSATISFTFVLWEYKVADTTLSAV